MGPVRLKEPTQTSSSSSYRQNASGIMRTGKKLMHTFRVSQIVMNVFENASSPILASSCRGISKE